MDFLKSEARRKTRKEKRKSTRIRLKENLGQRILKLNFSLSPRFAVDETFP